MSMSGFDNTFLPEELHFVNEDVFSVVSIEWIEEPDGFLSPLNEADYIDERDYADCAVSNVLTEELLGLLEPRDKEIIALRVGLFGSEPLTQTEVGARYALTGARIGQIENTAYQAMRQHFLGEPPESPMPEKPAHERDKMIENMQPKDRVAVFVETLLAYQQSTGPDAQSLKQAVTAEFHDIVKPPLLVNVKHSMDEKPTYGREFYTRRRSIYDFLQEVSSSYGIKPRDGEDSTSLVQSLLKWAVDDFPDEVTTHSSTYDATDLARLLPNATIKRCLKYLESVKTN